MTSIAAVVVRYVVWLGLCGLSLWTTLQVRLNVLDIIFHLRTSRWAIPALDKFSTVPLILAWLALAVALESYLVDAHDSRVFTQRAIRVTAVTLGVLAVSLVLQAVM